MEAGLTATIIEAPQDIQEQQPSIPSDMLAICRSQDIPTAGNAAGNTKDFLNLTGANVVATSGRGAIFP